MRYFTIICLLLALAACSNSEPRRSDLVDGGDTVELDADSDAQSPDASDAEAKNDAELPGNQCVCSTVGPCCDGCNPINPGESCDDGLTCTLGTTCQSDGTCAGASGSPCDELIDSPACQVATCDDVAGCSIRDAHEGFVCDDEDTATYDDRCASGTCAGSPCECSGENACCDGCFAQYEGQSCDDDNARTYGDACTAGACVGEPCECSEGACCDGCRFLPADTVCEDLGDERMNCTSPEQCGNQLVLETLQSRCTGDSPDCGEPDWYVTAIGRQCSDGQRCQIKPGTQHHYSCVIDNICY
jgi:hypothetical protein